MKKLNNSKRRLDMSTRLDEIKVRRDYNRDVNVHAIGYMFVTADDIDWLINEVSQLKLQLNFSNIALRDIQKSVRACAHVIDVLETRVEKAEEKRHDAEKLSN